MHRHFKHQNNPGGETSTVVIRGVSLLIITFTTLKNDLGMIGKQVE